MSPAPIRYTLEQKAAIETRRTSISLSAGAGCGKTFVLTQRFLKYLESDGRPHENSADPLSNVVAITFTERAAREMRDRIRLACAQRLNACSDGEAAHWLSILRRLDAARISTIHSFCASFLRRHAVEAKVDPQFELLDQPTADAFLRTEVARAVRRLIEAGNPDAMTLLFNYGLEPTCRMLAKLLSDYAMLDGDQSTGRTAAEIAEDWIAHFDEQFLPGVIGDFAASDVICEVCETLRANEPSHPVMQQRRGILLDAFERLATIESEAAIALLRELREAAKVQGGGNKNAWSTESAYETIKNGLEKIRKHVDAICEWTAFDRATVERAAELSAAAAKVVRAVAADYSAAKNDAGVLDFDDLLVRTRNLLRDSKDVRKQASHSIAALLVDEFQDTDPVQADIVRLLVGGELTSEKLFVVGDIKQSIYRFRGADPNVFISAREAIAAKGRLPLTENFRSQPEILHFVNSIFAPALGASYEPLKPHLPQSAPTPCIEFLFARQDAEEEQADRAADRRRREAEGMARRILEWLEDPTPRIPTKDPQTNQVTLRRVQRGDIAVLFRALSDVAIYEDVFRRCGIEYYLVGGRAFFAQQEVYDLVNLCTFLDDPDDAMSLVGLLRSPFFSLDDDTLVALAEQGPSLRAALDRPVPSDLPETQREQLQQASRVLGELSEKKDRLPLATLLELAIDRTGYDASLLHEFLGHRKVANLRKLVEMAAAFDRSGMGTLSDFTQRLRDSVAEETIEQLAATHPETSLVVRMMTIHQAKGLEFPIVIVADLERPLHGSGRGAVYHREFGPLLPLPQLGADPPRHLAIEMSQYVESREDEQESLRVLYVAMTRAADYLVLSAALPANGRLKSPWMRLLADRFDLETGLPKRDAYFGSSAAGTATCSAKVPEIRVHREPTGLTVINRKGPRREPLSRFHEIVENCEPSSLPPLMQAFPPQRALRRQFSVSAIEEADRALQGGKSVRPILRDVAEQAEADAENATVMGTVVHKVLEHLDGHNADRLNAIVTSVLKGLPATEARDLDRVLVQRRVENFLQSAAWKELTAAAKCFREIDFLLPWPADARDPNEAIIISGKLDCLARGTDDSWKVVDYKTGRIAQDPASVSEQYAIQLILYAEAVRALIGRYPDAIEILSVGEEVHRYPLRLWNEYVELVTKRINAAIEWLLTKNEDVI
jgi:ATP-dependent helicase/nuclease subunit A